MTKVHFEIDASFENAEAIRVARDILLVRFGKLRQERKQNVLRTAIQILDQMQSVIRIPLDEALEKSRESLRKLVAKTHG